MRFRFIVISCLYHCRIEYFVFRAACWHGVLLFQHLLWLRHGGQTSRYCFHFLDFVLITSFFLCQGLGNAVLCLIFSCILHFISFDRHTSPNSMHPLIVETWSSKFFDSRTWCRHNMPASLTWSQFCHLAFRIRKFSVRNPESGTRNPDSKIFPLTDSLRYHTSFCSHRCASFHHAMAARVPSLHRPISVPHRRELRWPLHSSHRKAVVGQQGHVHPSYSFQGVRHRQSLDWPCRWLPRGGWLLALESTDLHRNVQQADTKRERCRNIFCTFLPPLLLLLLRHERVVLVFMAQHTKDAMHQILLYSSFCDALNFISCPVSVGWGITGRTSLGLSAWSTWRKPTQKWWVSMQRHHQHHHHHRPEYTQHNCCSKKCSNLAERYLHYIHSK